MRCAKFVLLIFITFVTIQACIGAGRHVAYAVLYNFVCIMYKKIQKICKILQKNKKALVFLYKYAMLFLYNTNVTIFISVRTQELAYVQKKAQSVKADVAKPRV